mgnify:CR=1 FL=1
MGPTDGVPGPKPAKPRLLQDGRDMFWSLIPLLIACVALAAMVGQCSFQPKGPAEGSVPGFDVPLALHADAQALPFPVRMPALPEGWRANSGARGSIEQGRTDAAGKRVSALTSRVGYLAPSKMYVSLTQSDADESALVQSIQPNVYPSGTQDVGGVKWIVYRGGDGSEPVWTTRLDSTAGPAQLAITGAAGEADFRTLASATQTQAPLPRN